MCAIVKITGELEVKIIQWLTSEIVNHVRKNEPRGIRGISFLPEYKLQKVIFLLAEDWNLDITRVWYRYGGMICSSFPLRRYAENLYYRRITINPNDIEELKQYLGTTLMKDLTLSIQEKYKDIILQRGDDFLKNFYEEKAPSDFQSIYRTFRLIRRYYQSFMEPSKTKDVNLRKMLQTYDPWSDIYQFHKYLTVFQVEAAKLVDEEAIFPIVRAIRLLKKAIIVVTWRRFKDITISNNEYNYLNQIETEFENNVWKLIATYIAILSVKGVRAFEMKEFYVKLQKRTLTELPKVIHKIHQEMKRVDLFPEAAVLKKYLDAEFGDILRQVVG